MNHEDTWGYQQTKQRKGWRWQEFYLSWWFQPLWNIQMFIKSLIFPEQNEQTPPPQKKKQKKHETTINIYWLTFWTSFIGQFVPPFQNNPARHHSPLWRSALSFETVVPCAARFHAPEFFLSGVNGQCFPCFCWLKIMFEWPVYTCIYVQICI